MIIGNVSANPVLTATLNNYLVNPDGFVGRRLAPIFLTPEQSAQYYVFDRENMLSASSLKGRAPSTPFPRTKLKLSDDTYRTIDRGLEIPVDDGVRKKYAKAFDADLAAIRKIRNDVLLNHEIRVRDKATGASVASATLLTAAQWDNYAGASHDPVANVDAGKEAIHSASGMEANLMILPRAVFMKLKESPKILDKIKYSQRGVVTVEILQEVFGIPNIKIAGLSLNSAADGQTPVPADLWSDNVVLAHVEDSPALDAPNFMRTFVWTEETGPDGVLVETYRQNEIKSDVHRAQQWTDEKITGLELAYCIKDVLA